MQITVPLGRNEFPNRFIYGFPEFVHWMTNDVPKLETGRLNSSLTPSEQLDDILHTWIAGEQVRYSRMFQDLMPAEDEVWEMKTADLRIFGWMYLPRYFIAVFGDYTDLYKGPTRTKSYESAKQRVIAAREKIDLDSPKFATGTFDDLVRV